jgi:glycerol transport system ATP-binding protein
MPVRLEGGTVHLGSHAIALPNGPATAPKGNIELGIRPEFVRLGRHGMPATVSKVEDIGRHKIVRLNLEGQEIAAIAGEDEEIPAEAHVNFDPAGLNIYADSWRVAGQEQTR